MANLPWYLVVAGFAGGLFIAIGSDYGDDSLIMGGIIMLILIFIVIIIGAMEERGRAELELETALYIEERKAELHQQSAPGNSERPSGENAQNDRQSDSQFCVSCGFEMPSNEKLREYDIRFCPRCGKKTPQN